MEDVISNLLGHVEKHGAGAVLLAIAASTASAQARSEIRGKPTCSSCRITLSLEATLRDTAPADDRQPSVIKRDGSGRFFLVRPSEGRDVPAVFDSSGRFLARLGRPGAGPGEFRAARLVAFGPNDSSYLYDPANARLSVFSPKLRFVRSVPLPQFAFASGWAGDGHIAVSAAPTNPDRIGKPLHLVDGSGKVISSFGQDAGKPLPPGSEEMIYREITPAKGGGIWAADVWGRYRFQRFDALGKLELEVIRRADWFPEGKLPRVTIRPDEPPFPSVAAMIEDVNGLVWVFIRVADRRWPEALRPLQGSEEQHRYEIVKTTHDIADIDLAYDTIIEVFDPARKVLLATTRTDELYRFSVGPNRVGRLRRTSDGSLIPEIWRVRLERGSAKHR